MKANKKKSFLAGIPSWGLAGIALVVPLTFMIFLFILEDLLRIDENIGEPIFYAIFDLFNAACCFFIVRQNPVSVFYVPVICNLLGIFIAITSAKFWMTSEWMYFGSGWVLSIIASVLGYYMGRRMT